jgi:hypothetical protein
MLATANPNVLDADSSSSADIEVSMTTPDGDSLVGDHLAYSTKVIDGTGICGELGKTTGTTNADGFATVSYTASGDDIVCGLVIANSLGGQSATAVVYQGTYREDAPTASAAFPQTIIPGDDPTTFDVTFTNPGSDDFTSASATFAIFPADGATGDVKAGQVVMSTSFDGPNGKFEPLNLSGSTGADGAIQGTIDDVEFDAGDSTTITFEIALHDTVLTADAPMLAMEAYLDVINPANGAGTNLADTLASDVTVSAPDDEGSSPPIGLLIVGAVLFLAVAAGIPVVTRRRNHNSTSTYPRGRFTPLASSRVCPQKSLQ